MKKKIISFLPVLFITIYIYNNFFSNDMIEGVYVVKNNNIDSPPETPSVGDTLIIIDNKHFKSNFWGTGTYKLEYSIKGTIIDFTYKYEFGNAGFITSIERNYFLGNTIINLDADSNIYFEKTW